MSYIHRRCHIICPPDVEKIIAERSGFLGLNKTYYCIVEITKGPVLIFKKEREAKEIIKKAKSIEENDPELAINLYQKAMAILGEVDRLCEKNTEMDELIKIYGLKKWRFVEYPINRLTLLLENLMRFQECLEQIEKYEKIDDRIGLTKKDKESLDERKTQIIKNFHNKILHINRYRRNGSRIEND